jgi:hypothetical protein
MFDTHSLNVFLFACSIDQLIVRPNHVGAAISRHKRAGRIEERDGKLYASQATETAQHAAV